MLTHCKQEGAALYLHIPFCLRKCDYCDFSSFAGELQKKPDYIKALKEELALYPRQVYDTIYFGGGTPSLLEAEEVAEILSLLDYDEKTEITLECNPKTLNREKLAGYYRAGVNRLSLGIQSTKDAFLKTLGRLHSFEEAKAAYLLAREIGFDNISLDFIFALPGQQMEDLREDLREMLSLAPEHISIYSLIWEEGTAFFEKLQAGSLKKQENEVEAQMYQEVIQILKAAGYEHYEISNFAKAGYRSRHNQKYWKNQEYLGVGLGASGYLGQSRYTNVSDFTAYFKAIAAGQRPWAEEEVLTKEMQEQYTCLLAFRQLEEWISVPNSYQNCCDQLVEEDYLKKNKQGDYQITQKGLFFFNDMLEYFL